MKQFQKAPARGTLSYSWAQLEETHRYHIAELFFRGEQSNRWAFTNRLPRSDSKFWDEARYMVYDTETKNQIHRH